MKEIKIFKYEFNSKKDINKIEISLNKKEGNYYSNKNVKSNEEEDDKEDEKDNEHKIEKEDIEKKNYKKI